MSAKPRGGRGRLRRQSISTRGTLTPLSAAAVGVLVILSTVAAASVPWVRVVRAVYRVSTVAACGDNHGRRVCHRLAHLDWSAHACDRAIADTVLVAGLILLVTNVGAPAQYLAAALRRPLIDPWLAAADAFVGMDVGRLAGWTAGHPALGAVLQLAYASLLPQFLAAILLLGLLHEGSRVSGNTVSIFTSACW